ncbi:MAG: twin-arginine translocase subunit TatC [Muribaculaceae bacterium]|nr:twin-arginine translocase subunit TatC [Muribaculaceae bacterium]
MSTLLFIGGLGMSEEVFSIILAPKDSDFTTYRVMDILGGKISGDTSGYFSVQLINTGLAEQFIIHMKASMCVGVLCASPYIIYQLFRFVSPALYEEEKTYAVRVVTGGYIMFLLGVLLTYYMIFPLTFRFLGTYQISDDITNLISISSYISTLLVMSLCMGIVFEIPVLSWLFAKMGLISPSFMRHYRKHAIVIILIIAAIITPTSDVVTLLLVALPMIILYECSIFIIRGNESATPCRTANGVS